MRRFLLFVCALFVTAITTATGAYAATARPASRVVEPTLITYTRTGGFAGFRDTVTIDTAGVAHASPSQAEIRLSVSELDDIRGDLAKIRTWWSSPAGCDIADHITYSITYGDRRAVRCHAVPNDWQPAVSRLDDLLTRARTGQVA